MLICVSAVFLAPIRSYATKACENLAGGGWGLEYRGPPKGTPDGPCTIQRQSRPWPRLCPCTPLVEIFEAFQLSPWA